MTLIAASSLALIPLSDQIAECIKQLWEFWSSVSEAPDKVREIAVDLRLLSGVLAQIANRCKLYGTDEMIKEVLESCKDSTQDEYSWYVNGQLFKAAQVQIESAP